MIESETPKQLCYIVHPVVQNSKIEMRDNASLLEEAVGLAGAIDLDVIDAEIVQVRQITPATFIGSGKVKEYAEILKINEIDLVVFDDSLSPVQQKNLETAWDCKVIDRTALILEIFGERAQTKEGRLQVELAALEYQKGRLVRSWTHLERQRGGGGFLGGPGERQIESDRRQINDRIGQIRKQLVKVRKTRDLHRKNRQKVPYPIVALVGYTNAGKSTLFNKITGADVLAKDALFATLDPSMRLICLPSGKKVILSDTVGFISNLPTELVESFRATLEEVVEADLILHVRDIAGEDTRAQKHDVINVLESVLESKFAQMRDGKIIEILNKTDLLDEDTKQRISDNKRSQNYIKLSALKGDGIENLLEKIDEFFLKFQEQIELDLKPDQGHILAWLHQHGESVEVRVEGEDMKVSAALSDKDMGALKKLL